MDEMCIAVELRAVVICNCYPTADFSLLEKSIRVPSSQYFWLLDWTTYHAVKAVVAIKKIEASTLIPGKWLSRRQAMIFRPPLVKRHLPEACINAFPYNTTISLVFVSRPISGAWIPLDGYIAYKASS